MSALVTIYHLAALAAVESGFNDRAVGASGEVSRYQVRPLEWRSIARESKDYANEWSARIVAFGLLSERAAAFRRREHRAPTDAEMYLLWHRPARVLQPRKVEAQRAAKFSEKVQWYRRHGLPSEYRGIKRNTNKGTS